MKSHVVRLSEDEALVLAEYFNRFDETDSLAFAHPAEYLALQQVAAQIDKASSLIFDADYAAHLAAARERLADGYEGEVPGSG